MAKQTGSCVVIYPVAVLNMILIIVSIFCCLLFRFDALDFLVHIPATHSGRKGKFSNDQIIIKIEKTNNKKKPKIFRDKKNWNSTIASFRLHYTSDKQE